MNTISVLSTPSASIETNQVKRGEVDEFKRAFNELIDRFSESGATQSEIKRSLLEALTEGKKVESSGQTVEPKDADYINTGVVSSANGAASLLGGIAAAKLMENSVVKKPGKLPEDLVYCINTSEKSINTSGKIDNDCERIASVVNRAYDKFSEYEKKSGNSDLVDFIDGHLYQFDSELRAVTDQSASKEYEAAKKKVQDKFENELKQNTQVEYGESYWVYSVYSRQPFRSYFSVENNYNAAYNGIIKTWNEAYNEPKFHDEYGGYYDRSALTNVCKNALKSINEQLDEARRKSSAPQINFSDYSEAQARKAGVLLAEAIIKYCFMKEIMSSVEEGNTGSLESIISEASDKADFLMTEKGVPEWIRLNFLNRSIDIISGCSNLKSKASSQNVESSKVNEPKESEFTFDKDGSYIIIGGMRVKRNHDDDDKINANIRRIITT